MQTPAAEEEAQAEAEAEAQGRDTVEGSREVVISEGARPT